VRQPTSVCVWYSIRPSASSKSDLRNSRERERVSGELQSVVQFPAFARERLDPGLKPFFNKTIICRLLC